LCLVGKAPGIKNIVAESFEDSRRLSAALKPLPHCLSFCPSVGLFASLCMYILSVCLSVCLSGSVSYLLLSFSSLFLFVSVLSIYRSVCFSLYILFVSLSVCLSDSVSISLHLSLRLFTLFLFACL
jgi:hypothetical protein